MSRNVSKYHDSIWLITMQLCKLQCILIALINTMRKCPLSIGRAVSFQNLIRYATDTIQYGLTQFDMLSRDRKIQFVVFPECFHFINSYLFPLLALKPKCAAGTAALTSGGNINNNEKLKSKMTSFYLNWYLSGSCYFGHIPIYWYLFSYFKQKWLKIWQKKFHSEKINPNESKISRNKIMHELVTAANHILLCVSTYSDSGWYVSN